MVTMQPASVFHPHEIRMQRLNMKAQDVERMADLGRRNIRAFMPQQHIDFYCNQQVLLSCVNDGAGRPVATALVGPLGFISCPSPSLLRVSPSNSLDPELFKAGAAIGLLGIELHTRRRNRVNGIVRQLSGNTLDISVLQSYGNCPKYIQARHLTVTPAPQCSPQHEQQPLTGGADLGDAQQAFIRSADTFFLGSCYDGEEAAASSGLSDGASYIGCDVSHRSGPPGFVRVTGSSSLMWPDYVGNWFFNSLGNIMANGKVALLFIDFASGDTLHLQGQATIDMHDTSLPGAQRSVAMRVLNWRHAIRALPLRADSAPQPSPYNPTSTDGRERLFVKCREIVCEAEGIKTFRFSQPEAAGTSEKHSVVYQPGQYATFDFQGLEGPGKVTNRTWTISSHPDETAEAGAFSISVKRAGLASRWLHARAAPSDITLEWRGAGGEFVPAPGAGPVLLLAGGIGITPMRAMFLEFQKRGSPMTLLYSVRAPSEAAFLPALQAAAAGSGGRIRVALTVTGSRDAGWAGRRGRIDRGLIREEVPNLAACTAYMCGPDAFMQAVEGELHALGFPLARLHRESFAF